IRDADCRRLYDGGVTDDHRFNFGRAKTLAGDFYHVVGASQNVPEPIFVNSRPITVDPHVWETRPVGLDITFGVLPEPPCHTDPGLSNDQLSDLIANRSALIIHNLGGDTGYWTREGTRLEWGEQVAAENPPRYFSASRVINDRDA